MKIKYYEDYKKLLKEAESLSVEVLMSKAYNLGLTQGYDKGFSDGFNYDLELKVKEWEKEKEI